MSAVVAPADRRFRRAHVKPARRKSWLLAAVSALRLIAGVVIVGGGGFYVVQMAAYAGSGRPERLVYGAPVLNWILLADYLVLGVLARVIPERPGRATVPEPFRRIAIAARPTRSRCCRSSRTP